MDDQCHLNAKISDDGLLAELIVPADVDRAQLTPELCQAMLMRGGIELSATSPELIVQFIKHARASTGLYHGLIARGTPPTHGEDGYIDWTIDRQDSTASAPDADAAGDTQATGDANDPGDANDASSAQSPNAPASHYERSVYTIVKAGDVLGQLYHARPGNDGRSVTGKNLAAREGKPLEFQHDESIIIGKGNQVLAQADGVLDRSGKIACIRDTICVDEYVDFNTGNIRFNGNVVIQKGIRDCFTVEAQGDVEVRGLIEAATIITGGELRALGGFAGRDQGSAQVAGNLKAKYLDAVESYVRGDLEVDREVINCHTTVLGQVESPQGSIIGGDTLVAGRIDVAELGAEGLPLTTVQIGVVPHLDPLIRQLDALVAQLTHERQKLLEEQETIESASGPRVTSTHKERLCELMYEIAEVQTHLDRAEPSMQRAREKADAMRCVDVRVQKKVHPNTALVCGGLQYRIKSEMKGPLRIAMDDQGRLKFERDGGGSQMLASSADLTQAA